MERLNRYIKENKTGQSCYIGSLKPIWDPYSITKEVDTFVGKGGIHTTHRLQRMSLFLTFPGSLEAERSNESGLMKNRGR